MRTFNDAVCDQNEDVENAKVASVSCMHHCIQNICGGNEHGDGCRFLFPKKTYPAHSPCSHAGQCRTNGGTHTAKENL